jgi:integrase
VAGFGEVLRSDKGVNNILALLGRLLRAAVAKKLIATAPAVTMLKREQRMKRGQTKVKADGVRCYNEAQFGALLEAARQISTQAYLIVLLGGDHGLRRGEIMSLKWSDLDLTAGMLAVNSSVWLHCGKSYEGSPKGGSSRELDMTPSLKAALTKARRQTHDTYVLPRQAYKEFSRVIREVQTRAGFSATGKAHVLRHTFCSRLAMKGVPIKVIQTLAGHANIETTERYMHSDRDQERAAMRMLHVETPSDVTKIVTAQ